MTIPFQDFQNYFKNTTPGTTQDWAGGSLSMGDNGIATYTDPWGSTLNFNQNTPLSSLYQGNSNIANLWDQTYGEDTTKSLLPSGSGFDIPLDAYPKSSSSSGSESHSVSGIDWNSDLAKALLPKLMSSGQDLTDIVNNMSTTLQNKYSDQMRTALGPEAFQGTLNDLAAKGMLSSTVAKDTLATAGSDIAKAIAQQGWDSQLAADQAKMSIPTILGNLAQLAQKSTSSSQSGSSSETTNELAPYQLLAQMFMS